MSNFPRHDEFPGQPTDQYGQPMGQYGQPMGQYGQFGAPMGSRGPLGSMIPIEDRTAATIAHASTLVAMVLSANSLSFLGPLLMWLLYKDRSPYVRHAAAGAFNFNIWFTVVNLIAWAMVFSVLLAWIGIPLLVVTGVMQVWCHLRAAIKSSRGENYTYRRQVRILS